MLRTLIPLTLVMFLVSVGSAQTPLTEEEQATLMTMRRMTPAALAEALPRFRFLGDRERDPSEIEMVVTPGRSPWESLVAAAEREGLACRVLHDRIVMADQDLIYGVPSDPEVGASLVDRLAGAIPMTRATVASLGREGILVGQEQEALPVLDPVGPLPGALWQQALGGDRDAAEELRRQYPTAALLLTGNVLDRRWENALGTVLSGAGYRPVIVVRDPSSAGLLLQSVAYHVAVVVEDRYPDLVGPTGPLPMPVRVVVEAAPGIEVADDIVQPKVRSVPLDFPLRGVWYFDPPVQRLWEQMYPLLGSLEMPVAEPLPGIPVPVPEPDPTEVPEPPDNPVIDPADPGPDNDVGPGRVPRVPDPQPDPEAETPLRLRFTAGFMVSSFREEVPDVEEAEGEGSGSSFAVGLHIEYQLSDSLSLFGGVDGYLGSADETFRIQTDTLSTTYLWIAAGGSYRLVRGEGLQLDLRAGIGLFMLGRSRSDVEWLGLSQEDASSSDSVFGVSLGAVAFLPNVLGDGIGVVVDLDGGLLFGSGMGFRYSSLAAVSYQVGAAMSVVLGLSTGYTTAGVADSHTVFADWVGGCLQLAFSF